MGPDTKEITDLEAVRIEMMIRHSAQLLVKRKIDDKLKDFEIEGETFADLEKALLEKILLWNKEEFTRRTC